MRNTEGSIWLTAWTEVIAESWIMSNSRSTMSDIHSAPSGSWTHNPTHQLWLQCYSYSLAPFSDFITLFAIFDYSPTPPHPHYQQLSCLSVFIFKANRFWNCALTRTGCNVGWFRFLQTCLPCALFWWTLTERSHRLVVMDAVGFFFFFTASLMWNTRHQSSSKSCIMCCFC